MNIHRLLRRAVPALACAWGLCWPLAVAAFGPEGHRAVAELAQAQLTPTAREAVNHLLAQEPGASMGSVASWADETRSPETYAWHYVNFPRGQCRYLAERDCKEGQCVVAAIERQQQLLRSEAPDAEKLVALKYLIHFVGDVHQPLHGSFGDDRGGNTVSLQLGEETLNLHALWDSRMIADAPKPFGAWLTELEARPWTAVPQSKPAGWAEESCRIVSEPGFYPGKDFQLPGYRARWWPVLEQRVITAGHRLAKLLNQSFDGR
jgi:hypothetical protein